MLRLVMLLMIIGMVRDHHVRLRIDGDARITLTEVQELLPEATTLQTDHERRAGLTVFNASGQAIGYAVRTAPLSNELIGYAGPTDTLLVLDANDTVVGMRIRKSWDTPNHVADVVAEDYFMNSFNGMTWEGVATLKLKESDIEGVSGATMTSMTVAEGTVLRFASAFGDPPARELRFGVRDLALIIVVVATVVATFRSKRLTLKQRRICQAIVIVYIGFINGDLLAQSLIMGWSTSGVPWHTAPGLVLLLAAALLFPWATSRPLYCAKICPHGALQEMVGKVLPKRYRRPELAYNLRWLPAALLGAVLVVTMLVLPLDLAGVEPFDAYIIKAAGVATISVAVIGLIAAMFIPKAYCKYGCPTGALLVYVRSSGKAERFGRRDVVAAALVALTALLKWQHDAIQVWIAALY
jgi:Na+-translocating ferredoxin:NAD+ oxidoreductase RnfG subunit